ncbi:ABC transporter ATP-binding protein [Vagococcus silagei]|uniref:ABC transporter ATP-binding protein n=1 Tax=Vagococcus silagei TaxID=2508885 RepID=A0A4S3AZ24_9ENTE|nr:ABC transporter ATP-binding protein [Vagococcus silagei]THB60074.1 ABC transporter ATP-binding protein [Vagococcus silagei]
MSGRPGHGGMNAKKDKPKNMSKTLKRLLSYMMDKIHLVMIVIVLAIAATIFQIVTPKILGKATTTIFEGFMKAKEMIQNGEVVGKIPIDFDRIGKLLLIVLALYAAAALFSFIQQFIMTRVTQRIVYQLRLEFNQKMNRLPVSYFDTHSNGDIMSRAINDMDNIATTLQQGVTQFLTSVVMLVGILIMMFSISWKLSIVALLTIPLSLIVIMFVAPKSQKFFSKQQKSLGLLNDKVEETYGAHIVTKSFNHEEADIANFEQENEVLYQASWKAQFISTIIMPLMDFIKNIGYIMVAVIGGIQVAHGQMAIGDVQAFMQYTTQFSQPISQLASIINTIQATIASAERIFEVLDEAEMQDEKVDVLAPQSDAKIIFKDVAFGYSEESLLMKKVNFEVQDGQKVAIVGPTGAGKTTMINLLERFYDINSGFIFYNKQETRNLKRDELREHFSMVLQDTWLFTGSIYDNIHYGRLDATEEEVYAAAKAAHVDDFVRRLPEGYQTELNEEASNISQGQRQLITIARAFLVNPDVLILDEATSSVDTRTEILIQKAMENLLENRTSFVVAHRLSTIRDADKIMVMNEGDIVEIGNHDELMSQNDFYADLYNSQFSDALEA